MRKSAKWLIQPFNKTAALMVTDMQSSLSLVYLKYGVLSGNIVVTAFLNVAKLPFSRAGLIEGLHCSERDVPFVLVVLHNLCQIVHKCSILSGSKVV